MTTILDTIGHTPLVALQRVVPNGSARIVLKLAMPIMIFAMGNLMAHQSSNWLTRDFREEISSKLVSMTLQTHSSTQTEQTN